MRLLLWYWGRRGGGAQFTLELARALSRHPDVQLALSVSRWGDLTPELLRLGAPCDQIETYRSAVEFVLALPRARAAATRLARQAAAFGADVVVSTMPHLWTPIAARALRRAGVQYVPIIHDADPHPGDPSLFWDWRMRTDMNAAFAAITLTRAVGVALKAAHPGLAVATMKLGAHLPPEVVPITSDVAPDPRPVEVRGLRLLCFGRVLPYKGLDLLRDAFREVSTRHPGIGLRVVGAGDAERLAPGLSRLPNVELVNRWISEAELPIVFGACDAVVLSHREASQSGVVPIAVAMGRPVVATAVGGLPEQVTDGHDGLIAQPNATALAAAIERLYDPATLGRLTLAARESGVELRSWESHADRLVCLLRELGIRSADPAMSVTLSTNPPTAVPSPKRATSRRA
jgi:glycosyltransferase involved in cell wall biosynthesis